MGRLDAIKQVLGTQEMLIADYDAPGMSGAPRSQLTC